MTAPNFDCLHPDALAPTRPGQPLLLLDIDGVLNAFRYRPGQTPLPDDAYDDLAEFTVPTTGGQAFRFWTSPRLIADIVALHEAGAAEIAWVTTWEHDANLHAGPILGLPEFPVAAMKTRFDDYSWKPCAAVEALQLGRPVVWIDDVEIGEPQRRAYADSGLPHVLISPDPRHGLTRSDVARVRDFLDEQAGGHG